MPRENLRNHKPWLALAAILASLAPSLGHAATVNYAWSPVGNPGNAADPGTGFGAVAYNYNIGTYDVTVGQYAAFLNAVAATDPYGLWNSLMATGWSVNFGVNMGIAQNNSSGSYSYSVIGNPNVPITYVSWGDAARFANWMQNGQPIGPEGPGTTETGAYTLNGTSGTNHYNQQRNPRATVFLPTENEWYKAAYYDPANGTYWLYPTQSNTAPSNVLSPTGTNNANYYDLYGGTYGYTDPTNFLTPVGAFADSPGPYGAYDMAGDVWQWNEGAVTIGNRDVRGGAWNDSNGFSLSREYQNFDQDYGQFPYVGFRLASLPVPEPSAWLLATMGVGGLWFVRRRKR